MIKCKYCSVINNKDYGTCDKCGAPLDVAFTIDEDDLDLEDDIDLYRYGIISKDEAISRIENLGASWENAVKHVSLDDWKKKMLEAGVGRILDGIEAAQSKIKQMPDLTLEDNINRATTYLRETAKFHNKKE